MAVQEKNRPTFARYKQIIPITFPWEFDYKGMNVLGLEAECMSRETNVAGIEYVPYVDFTTGEKSMHEKYLPEFMSDEHWDKLSVSVNTIRNKVENSMPKEYEFRRFLLLVAPDENLELPIASTVEITETEFVELYADCCRKKMRCFPQSDGYDVEIIERW